MSSIPSGFSPQGRAGTPLDHASYPTPLSGPGRAGPDPGAEYPEHNDTWSGDESGAEGEDGSKKRKRPMSVSCEMCKQRKVKCDRGQPTCGWCSRNGQICEYKERKKPGLRAGYGRELEARLDRLEDVLQSHQTSIDQLMSNHTILPSVHTTSDRGNNIFNPTNSNMSVDGGAQSRYVANSSEMPEIQHRFTATEYQASNRDLYTRQEPHMQQGVAQNQSLYSSNPGTQIKPPPSLSLNDQPLASASQDQDLPPYDLLYAMVDLYFKHVNTWCPILHRRTTLDALFGTSSLEEADRILLHAIVATTLRFSNDERLTPEKRESFYATSKQKVLLYGMENSSVKALQALVILATDIIGIANGAPAWNLMALIARSVVHLGLSVEPTSKIVAPASPSIYLLRAMILSEPTNWIEDESRRRLFWMVYVLDRSTTIPSALDFTLDERDIDRKLPCRDDLFSRNQRVDTKWFSQTERDDKTDKPENLGSFSYYVEIVGIMSRTHRFLKTPVDISNADDVQRWQNEYRELDSVINSWRLGLPKEYSNMARLSDSSANNKIVNCGWILLQVTYHLTVLRLHSAAAYPTHRSKHFAASYNAGQRCLGAVDAISTLCAYVKSNGMLNKLGPPFAFVVWVAARLLLVHSSTIDHQINPKIHFFVGIMRELAVYWNVAHRYATLLQRVLDEYAEFEASANNDGSEERATPSSVKILADMRRTAFDLDFIMSHQPRQNGVRASPSPGDLDLLDVFDFFMMPRLPNVGDAQNSGGLVPPATASSATYGGLDLGMNNNQINITNFAVDANSDWFLNNIQD